MSNGRFWQDVQKVSKSTNYAPVQVGQIASKKPLEISFNGLTLSKANGDKIYINSLLLDDNIDLDVSSMDNPQDISPALKDMQDRPTSQITIDGTQKTFLTDFYNFFKEFHKKYIIDIGDYVAVQKLGNNTYLVLEKVQVIE